MMRGANKNAALAFRGLCRRTCVGSGRQTRSADATPEQSRMTARADRAKSTSKIDVVLFVPSHSAFCRRAELLLLCGVPFAALFAVLAIVLQRAM
ncbi:MULTISPECIES: hypothetical protein [unclassified Shinella]|uniref:hypothetical protein n=1 Tax=unclassified Shinella TaxID=2643062 RepID=UPI00234E5603|nr:MULTISPECIES: hypothetical protein [unclassified Shinella]MCO5139036.1 hypothetical protein [Shinella sp.]MDC7256235.1 hypothetical protein [Shinella sp. YE25]